MMYHMIGNSILVAPIFNEDGEANYYLSEGNCKCICYLN